ncbi:hypothetical protein [Brucella rhizosphaerae]|uniref:Uncharacterized protein n=1 Tax=Brucella rhizosphaerae TaxID=571254 RepID=A0A256EZK4_9HYPH|nr:hypothetical protein [Brucella rhizosphaerae]OYR08058.1 hypothetical protein CEV32_2769 [Brucella rhizosphaerae]
MRIRPLLIVFALSLPVFSTATAQAADSCVADAVQKAKQLLLLQSDNDDRTEIDAPTFKKTGTIKALRGKGKFDVIEGLGYVYKGEYRLRLYYAEIGGDCVLMGQEVVEYADPFS